MATTVTTLMGLVRKKALSFSKMCVGSLPRTQSRNFHVYEGTARCPYPMTQEEAYDIAGSFLGIEHPQSLFRDDPEELLRRVATRMRKVVSFSTAPMFAIPGRTNDSVGKEIILKARVGSCNSINPFTKAILDHIGYRTMEVLGRSPEVGYDHHMGNIICDVTHPGSQHFIEPGSRLLLTGAIPLDFERESPVYKIHSMTYRFFKREGNLLWCKRIEEDKAVETNSLKFVQDGNGEQWQTMLFYWLKKPNAKYHLNQYLNKLISGQTVAPDNVMRFLFSGCLHEDFVNIWADAETVILHVFHEGGRVIKRDITHEEMMTFFNENFPLFAQSLLNKVVEANFCFVKPKGRM